jgi:hypothetical protein
MLTKMGKGKTLTREYADLYAKGAEDRTQLSDEEIAWLELPDDVGLGEHDPRRFKVQSQPIDHRPGASPRNHTIDIRKRNACGDGDDDDD